MDNRDLNKPEFQNDDWFDQFLAKPTSVPEIEPDQQAIKAAGLRHPDDLDLENILAEDWNEPIPEETIPEEILSEPVPVTQEVPEEDEELVDTEPAPVQKLRPKKKKGSGLVGIPHLLSTVIWLLLILGIHFVFILEQQWLEIFII